MIRPLPETTDRMPEPSRGFGSLKTEKGVLPLTDLDVHAELAGTLASTTVCQTFQNPHDEAIEATYIFPLPPRAAVTSFRMEVADRVVEGKLKERGEARRTYQKAIEKGHRAAIAEQERDDIFTMRVGNLMPGEEAKVTLSMSGPLPYQDGDVTFRFPLVVAPRYIPGQPLDGPSVGDGTATDTDAVPDASRIRPPVLLPGFPNPVRLSIRVDLDEAGLPVGELRSSLHDVVTEEEQEGGRTIRLARPERLNRDFILRYRLAEEGITSGLTACHDPDREETTFLLTLVPPHQTNGSRKRDVVFVLDRSGSMGGWKMVAARRALARMVDTLTDRDRFSVCVFDNEMEWANDERQLVTATNRNRFRAIEFLAGVDARGGTEMAAPLSDGARLLGQESEEERERILVLVTDGQVGNEQQILTHLSSLADDLRIFTLGIDRAVSGAFLEKLAELGRGGSCSLVESEDRLDAVMDKVHRRIGTPVLTDLRIEGSAGEAELVPERLPDLFAEAPVRVAGRLPGALSEPVRVVGRRVDGTDWSCEVTPVASKNPAIRHAWARRRVRALQDRFLLAAPAKRKELESEIVGISLDYGVLCRFTAFVAVDREEVVNPEGDPRTVVQPVEAPEGWDMFKPAVPPAASPAAGGMARMASFGAPGGSGIDELADMPMAEAAEEFEAEPEPRKSLAKRRPRAEREKKPMDEKRDRDAREVSTAEPSRLLTALREARKAGEAALATYVENRLLPSWASLLNQLHGEPKLIERMQTMRTRLEAWLKQRSVDAGLWDGLETLLRDVKEALDRAGGSRDRFWA